MQQKESSCFTYHSVSPTTPPPLPCELLALSNCGPLTNLVEWPCHNVFSPLLGSKLTLDGGWHWCNFLMFPKPTLVGRNLVVKQKTCLFCFFHNMRTTDPSGFRFVIAFPQVSGDTTAWFYKDWMNHCDKNKSKNTHLVGKNESFPFLMMPETKMSCLNFSFIKIFLFFFNLNTTPETCKNKRREANTFTSGDWCLHTLHCLVIQTLAYSK